MYGLATRLKMDAHRNDDNNNNSAKKAKQKKIRKQLKIEGCMWECVCAKMSVGDFYTLYFLCDVLFYSFSSTFFVRLAF